MTGLLAPSQPIAQPTIQATALEGPLFLFLLSALWGLWFAYDKPMAWTRFGLVVGGIALYQLLARLPSRLPRLANMAPLPTLLAVLPTGIGLLFLLTYDTSHWPTKLATLAPVGEWLAAWRPGWGWPGIHPNTVGGVIAALLPLQLVALGSVTAGQRRIGVAIPLVGLSALALLLSGLRGAWLALGVTAGFWLALRVTGATFPRLATPRRRIYACLVLVALGIGAVALAPTLAWLGNRLLAVRPDRVAVWRNSLDLASDYPFTGIGLGGFEMAYSSYALLVHVPHTSHAHNLMLDLWLEQGLLGVLAFGWLLLRALALFRSRRPGAPAEARLAAAAVLSLGVIVVHGLVDDSFYGYGGWGIPLLFVPLSVLARASAADAGNAKVGQTAGRWLDRAAWGAGALGLLTLLLPTPQAAWQANLGALAQTQAELSVYRWPAWFLQDALRRSPAIDLAPAIAHYTQALALNPHNVTAQRRLGQIELSRGQYETACAHLEAAYALAPYQRATRQLLGECYAIQDKVAPAVVLWQTVNLGEGQLDLRQAWYEHIGAHEQAAWIAQAAQRRGP